MSLCLSLSLGSQCCRYLLVSSICLSLSLSLGSQCCRYLLVSSICLSLSLSLWAVSAVDISSSLVYVSLSLRVGRWWRSTRCTGRSSSLFCCCQRSAVCRSPLFTPSAKESRSADTSRLTRRHTSLLLHARDQHLQCTLVQKTSCWDLNIIFPSENMIKDDQKRPFFLWHFTWSLYNALHYIFL